MVGISVGIPFPIDFGHCWYLLLDNSCDALLGSCAFALPGCSQSGIWFSLPFLSKLLYFLCDQSICSSVPCFECCLCFLGYFPRGPCLVSIECYTLHEWFCKLFSHPYSHILKAQQMSWYHICSHNHSYYLFDVLFTFSVPCDNESEIIEGIFLIQFFVIVPNV
jgi:hypothetical protein